MNLKGITATATLSLPNISSKDFITRSIPVISYEALTEAAFPVLEDYSSNLQMLIECLKGYCQQWIDCEAVLESCCGVSVSYRALPEERPNTNYTGRPRYVITKDQLVYLSSLNFKVLSDEF